MNIQRLEKCIKERDNRAELIQDNPPCYRILIYSQRQKFPITSLIDRNKHYKITKISDYPKQEGYPICVVRIEKLRIANKRKKRQTDAKNLTTKANIK